MVGEDHFLEVVPGLDEAYVQTPIIDHMYRWMNLPYVYICMYVHTHTHLDALLREHNSSCQIYI